MKKEYFDPLDYQIIHLLQGNGRASASEIARHLALNERTIRKRIDQLVLKGAIRLTAIVNPDAFSYVISVDIFLEADPLLEKQVIAQLASMSEVAYIALSQTAHEVSIESRFKNNEDFRTFLLFTLPAVEGIKVKGYAIVPRILKNIDEWMPKMDDFSKTEGED